MGEKALRQEPGKASQLSGSQWHGTIDFGKTPKGRRETQDGVRADMNERDLRGMARRQWGWACLEAGSLSRSGISLSDSHTIPRHEHKRQMWMARHSMASGAAMIQSKRGWRCHCSGRARCAIDHRRLFLVGPALHRRPAGGQLVRPTIRVGTQTNSTVTIVFLMVLLSQ